MTWLLRVLAAVVAAMTLAVSPALAASTGGSGGPLTNRTFLSFTGSQYTSEYHLYASGLDWTKPVGLLIYADGSGEYGLKNPGSTYLLAGTNGLIAVAKRNNMVLLTPFSPNKACSDGDGSCWYLGDPVGYAKWAEELVTSVQGLYPLETDRVAFGGYSSGAQLTTEYWIPSGAAQRTMTDGVLVAISYGGSPKMTEVSYSSSFKGKVHINWNTGSQDSAYTTTSSYGVKAGYNHYTGRGFATSLDVISGLGHSRSDFGLVMEAQIKEHVPTGSTGPAPGPVDYHSVMRTPAGMIFAAHLNKADTYTLRASKSPLTGQVGWYEYDPADALGNLRLELSSFEAGLPYYWQLESSTGAVLVQGQVPAAPASWTHTLLPTRVGALFDVFVPSGTSQTTVRISSSFSTSSGWYLYTTGTGMQQFDFTPSARLSPGQRYEYRIENGSGTVVASGTFTTLW